MKYKLSLRLLSMFFFTTIFVISSACSRQPRYAVIISANAEWKAILKIYPHEDCRVSVWGQYFYKNIANNKILFFHEGWGKVSAAGATQFVIDKFNPEILINLGTCGGIQGAINKYDIVLADRTVIYDISEAMGDSREAINSYSTRIDLSWLGENFPVRVTRTLLVSADKDLRKEEIDFLRKEYSAVAADWESGAIAYVAGQNKKKILILRGVTDIVSNEQAEAYGNIGLFETRTDSVMIKLINDLPKWISSFGSNQ